MGPFLYFLFVVKNNLLLYEAAEITCFSKLESIDEKE